MPIALATESEKRERDVLCFEAWGSPLTQDVFIEREAYLRASRFSKENLQTWLLKNETGQVLASCETYRMHSTRHGRIPGHAYGIASVYTEPKYRRKGYAYQLIDQIMRHIESEKNLQAFHLYSEVGPTLYERLGFTAVPSEEWWIPSAPSQTAIAPTPLSSPAWLTQEQLINSTLKSTVNSIPDPSPYPFVISPSPEQLEWFWMREEFYARALKQTPLPYRGAQTEAGTLIWTADFRGNCLRVLLVKRTQQPSRSQHLIRLVDEARHFAHASNLPVVRAWVTHSTEDFNLISGAQKKSRNDDCLSMIRPVDPLIKASDWSEIHRGIWV